MNIRFSYDQRFERLIESIRLRYGDDILSFSGIHPHQLDMAAFTRDFLFNGGNTAVADVSVDANANVDDRSVVSFDHEVAKALSKLNALNMIWAYILKSDDSNALQTANKAIEAIIKCSLYLNDAHFVHKSYCFSFDLMPLVHDGMPFITKLDIGPPRHFDSFIDLVIQAVAYISNQIAGAVSLPNLLVYLDWFARKDFGDRYFENQSAILHIQQGFQNLVYSMNFPFRGSQSPFLNMSIYDRPFMESLFSGLMYPDSTGIVYESVDIIQRMFIDWLNQESDKQIFTFPVVTSNHVAGDDGIEDDVFLDYVAGANLKYGLLNMYTGPATCLSSCCRLRSELIREHTNSLGTGSVSIGSHRVCTINLPRIAIESDGNRRQFFTLLKERVCLSHAILNAHRMILCDLIKQGKLPLYTHDWMHLSKQYSTVGLLGPYEAVKFMGMDILTTEGSDFVVEIMDTINDMGLQEEKKWADSRRFNLELIPGEQAAIKLCESDKMLYPDFHNPYRLYSNQFIPLIEQNASLHDRIMLQGKFDSRAQGGCIFHANIDHRIRNKDQMKQIISAVAGAGGMYFAVNLNIAICERGHKNVGKGILLCPVCGAKIVKNMTRVVGFITNVSDWNMVRRWEYDQRHFYTIDNQSETVAHSDGEDGFDEKPVTTEAHYESTVPVH